MKIDYQAKPPAVHIHYAPSFQPHAFQQLLYGIEEEGIPFLLTEQGAKTAVELGFEAANESVLGVGIGAGEDQVVCLHFQKLPPQKPLFQLSRSAQGEQLRALGANSARLVKRMPFVSLESVEPLAEKPSPPAELSKEEISRIVAQIIARMNK